MNQQKFLQNRRFLKTIFARTHCQIISRHLFAFRLLISFKRIKFGHLRLELVSSFTFFQNTQHLPVFCVGIEIWKQTIMIDRFCVFWLFGRWTMHWKSNGSWFYAWNKMTSSRWEWEDVLKALSRKSVCFQPLLTTEAEIKML